MDRKTKWAFLTLILLQALHSLEEVLLELWRVFAPARRVADLFSDEPAVGFAAANAAFVLFGFWCFVARVLPDHKSARYWVLGWTVLEVINGFNHLALAAYTGEYFPGAYTAPFLLLCALYIAVRRRHWW